MLSEIFPWLLKIVLPALIIWRLWYVEKSNVKKDLLLDQHEKNLKATREYNANLEDQLQKADVRHQEHKNALRMLAPDDPRWNELLFEDATEVLDSIHIDPTQLGDDEGK